MPKYLVRYKNSNGRRLGYVVAAPDMATAKKRVKKSSVTIVGVGGQLKTVSRILSASRVPDDTPEGEL